MSSFHQPWIQVESEKHKGRHYYSNTITNESQWEPPNGKDFISKTGDFNVARFIKYITANPTIDLLKEGESQYRATGGTNPDFIQFVFDNVELNDKTMNEIITTRIVVKIIKTILDETQEPPSNLFSLVLFGNGHGGSQCVSERQRTKMTNSANILFTSVIPPGAFGYDFTETEGRDMAHAVARKRGKQLSSKEKEPFRERIIESYRTNNPQFMDRLVFEISIINGDIKLIESIPEKLIKKEKFPLSYATFDPLKTINEMCVKYELDCRGFTDPEKYLLFQLRRKITEKNEMIASIRRGQNDYSYVAKTLNSTANMQILSSCSHAFANIMGLFVVKTSFEVTHPEYSRIIMIMLYELNKMYKEKYNNDEIAINSLFKNEKGYKPNDTGMFYRLLYWFGKVYNRSRLDVTQITESGNFDPSRAITLISNIFLTTHFVKKDGSSLIDTSKIDIMYIDHCCRLPIPRPDPETIVGSPPKGGTSNRRHKTRRHKTRRHKTRR
jgi:hypothetical protein